MFGQLFETAKNVSLYSWFVYRFHQGGRNGRLFRRWKWLLRERAGNAEFAPHGGARIPGLSELLTRAKAEKWMRTEDFPSLRVMAMKRGKGRAICAVFTETRHDA